MGAAIYEFVCDEHKYVPIVAVYVWGAVFAGNRAEYLRLCKLEVESPVVRRRRTEKNYTTRQQMLRGNFDKCQTTKLRKPYKCSL